MSDLHFDSAACDMPRPVPGVDAVVVAGDTCTGSEKAFAYLRAAFPAPLPLIVVLGNREFHGRALVGETRRARSIASDYEVELLDDGQAVLGGVRFLGATLWTDYRLEGEDRQIAAVSADARRGDYARIALTDRPYRPFTPADAIARYEASSAYLAGRLAEPFDGPTVVVTHYAPSARSLYPERVGGTRDASYASALDSMIVGAGPVLWVHGHVHRSCDCSVAEVPWREIGFEGAKLGYLVNGCGLFHNGHRAVDDCHALLEVLAHDVDGASAFSHLLRSSRSTRVRVWAERAPFDRKDVLKARGYRWNGGGDGRPKAWWTEVDQGGLEAELGFLEREVQLCRARLRQDVLTAHERYRPG